MSLMPGVPRAAVRQLEVSADVSAVMAWLTDSDRRKQEWRRRVAARKDIREPSVSRLPNGGLRFELVYSQGDKATTRHVLEDVAVRDHRIDRVLRGEVRSAQFIGRGRWVVKQRIVAEPLAGATRISIWARGRLVGWMPVLQHLGYSDTAWGRFLTEQASQLADFVVDEVATQFPDRG